MNVDIGLTSGFVIITSVVGMGGSSTHCIGATDYPAYMDINPAGTPVNLTNTSTSGVGTSGTPPLLYCGGWASSSPSSWLQIMP